MRKHANIIGIFGLGLMCAAILGYYQLLDLDTRLTMYFSVPVPFMWDLYTEVKNKNPNSRKLDIKMIAIKLLPVIVVNILPLL
ncbi:MAG: hypothetical protein R3B39_01260 [Candidatus Paceibacterota bacterium]